MCAELWTHPPRNVCKDTGGAQRPQREHHSWRTFREEQGILFSNLPSACRETRLTPNNLSRNSLSKHDVSNNPFQITRSYFQLPSGRGLFFLGFSRSPDWPHVRQDCLKSLSSKEVQAQMVSQQFRHQSTCSLLYRWVHRPSLHKFRNFKELASSQPRLCSAASYPSQSSLRKKCRRYLPERYKCCLPTASVAFSKGKAWGFQTFSVL